MSNRDDANRRLNAALDRVEAAARAGHDNGEAEAARAEAARLADQLRLAQSEKVTLDDSIRTVSRRLDATISRLAAMLET